MAGSTTPDLTIVPAAPVQAVQEVLATIPAFLHAEIARLLRFGAQAGWTCEELLSQLGFALMCDLSWRPVWHEGSETGV